MIAFIWSWTAFRNMMMKIGVGRRESTPNPYRRYTDTEAFEKMNPVSASSRLLAKFTAFPVTRNSDNREMAFLYPVSPEMLCLLM